jgi:hypothetical protein
VKKGYILRHARVALNEQPPDFHKDIFAAQEARGPVLLSDQKAPGSILMHKQYTNCCVVPHGVT